MRTADASGDARGGALATRATGSAPPADPSVASVPNGKMREGEAESNAARTGPVVTARCARVRRTRRRSLWEQEDTHRDAQHGEDVDAQHPGQEQLRSLDPHHGEEPHDDEDQAHPKEDVTHPPFEEKNRGVLLELAEECVDILLLRPVAREIPIRERLLAGREERLTSQCMPQSPTRMVSLHGPHALASKPTAVINLRTHRTCYTWDVAHPHAAARGLPWRRSSTTG